jgi:hypothetical protein
MFPMRRCCGCLNLCDWSQCASPIGRLKAEKHLSSPGLLLSFDHFCLALLTMPRRECLCWADLSLETAIFIPSMYNCVAARPFPAIFHETKLSSANSVTTLKRWEDYISTWFLGKFVGSQTITSKYNFNFLRQFFITAPSIFKFQHKTESSKCSQNLSQ